jgi:hypothetical protein
MLDALDAWVRERFEEEAEQPPLSEQIELLARLREQNLDPEPPDNDGRRVKQGVAPDRITSLSDPDMRHGRKSKSKTFNGYKSHLATELDKGLVLAAAITPANRPEAEGLDLMRSDIVGIAKGKIAELHVDRAYVHAEYAEELRREGVLFFSKARSIRGGGLFDKTAFKIDLRSKTATCPADQVVRFVLGEAAHFDADACNRCPLRKKCTTSARGRTLSIPADEPLQRKLRKLSATRSGRAKQRERVGIEHRLAHHAQKQGRKARFRGLPKNLLDARRHAAIINLEVIHRDLANAA